MDEKRCSTCAKKLPLSSFLADTSADMTSKVFATCIPCRERSWLKRKAAQPPSHPRRHSRHTSLDYCSRCRHTLPPSTITNISIDPRDNTLKTCSSCQYRSRRNTILPPAMPPLPESPSLTDIALRSPLWAIAPLPVSRSLSRPVSPPVVPQQVPLPALPQQIPPRPASSRPASPPVLSQPASSRPVPLSTDGFLSADGWGNIQNFNKAMG